ncbi:YfbK domain-containing protein [Haliangium sp.]|uniref:YfbK domain-containing protein n=1 Tax=Haliangium sp. TaxID=2663208 RepID=UPI003D15300E
MQRIAAIVFAALIGLSFTSDAVLAQAVATLQGRVIDADTGQGIAGATIIVRPSGKRLSSAADGRFSLPGLAPGKYRVECRKAGYRPDVQRGLRMSAGQITTHECRLRARRARDAEEDADAEAEPAPEAAAPAEVRADRKPRRRRHRGKKEVSGYGSGSGRAAGQSANGAGGLRPPPRPVAPAPATKQALVLTQPPPPPGDAGGEMSREQYDEIDENPFRAATEAPLSTFSIDVDTASYSNMRRFLNESRMPPRDAVKIEELINYFSYDYPEPKGKHPFAVHTEVSVAPWNPSHRLVKIGLQGKRVSTEELPPSNLVFLMDVSGSMNQANKLPLLKAAFRLLVDNLRPQDRVAIVVYAGAAGVVLPSTPGTDKGAILAAIERLSAGGSTAGGAGIELAYRIARENFVRGGNNRIVLATDGDFNVGTSSDGELVQLIEDKRKSGVFLTVLGFGTGNYQDAKMEKLADRGNGNHAYIDSILEAEKVLVREMGGTLFTIAKDVKIQVEFNPNRVKGYRLIGYENRMLRAQDFNDDKKDAGELGAGHTVTALYEIIPAGSDEAIPGVDALKYQRTAPSAAAASDELLTVKLRYKRPDGHKSTLLSHVVRDTDVPLARTSDDFRFATAVAELGLLLRNSEHKGTASYQAVLARAETALGADREGYRKEFLSLARKAMLLARR